MYAALRAISIPDDAVARLFHAASLLREHRGDGHIAALMIEGVGGLEAHVLLALDMGMQAEKFGRIHHLPTAQLVTVIDGMRGRGLIGDDGWLSEKGRAVKQRVESLTDDLAAKPYESLEPGELEADGRPRAPRHAPTRRPGLGRPRWLLIPRGRSQMRQMLLLTWLARLCDPSATCPLVNPMRSGRNMRAAFAELYRPRACTTFDWWMLDSQS